MTAYAMAKAAGEILCSDMSRSWPGMNVLSPRLPRLATDQTASISLLDRDTPLVSEVLLPIVRQAERRPLKEQCFS
jgi:nucleoside-diphosphate-sugar epimerase